jgi:hypothetical protein
MISASFSRPVWLGHRQHGRVRGRSGRREEVAEERHELGVELGAGMPAKLGDRFVVADRSLVRTVVGHRVVGVGDGHDPRAERDLGSAQAERVPVTGISLMVMEDDRDRILQRGSLLEDDLADPRMLDDAPPLRARELRWLVEDLGWQDNLANVVEQRRDADPVDLLFRQLQRMSHRHHDRRDCRRRLSPV